MLSQRSCSSIRTISSHRHSIIRERIILLHVCAYLKSRHNSKNKVTLGPTFTRNIKPWVCIWNSKASGNLKQESGVPLLALAVCPPSHSFQCPLHTHISLSQPADLGGGEQLRALPGAFRLVGCLLKTCESQNPGQMDWRPLQSLTPAHPPSPILSSLVLAGAGPQITLSPGESQSD